MTRRSPITAMGVVIPARDEEDRIEGCLHSVRTALDRLPGTVTTAVTVVLDRCGDRTPDRVEAAFADWPGAVAVRVAALGGKRAGSGSGRGPAHIVAGSGVGAVRHLGVRQVLEELREHAPRATWLLNTDADTTVPPDWALLHLRHAVAGACGIAGIAELDQPDDLTPEARRRYGAIIRAGLHSVDPDRTAERAGSDRLGPDQHDHVYGANLGVRADAYLAVGGFPVDVVGEDHGLWQSLATAGYPLVRSTGISVRTSSRLLGRATGGLADLLRTLHGPPPGIEGPDTRDGA